MRITARELNRATLARQMLLRRQSLGVVDAVRRVVALQAQQSASPYLALWNRLTDFDPADLDAAFADHTVVKATLMRITLHAVHIDDYGAFYQAMLPTLRASRLGSDPRFKATGLSSDDVDALLRDLLEFAGSSRTNAEFEAWLAQRLGANPKPGPWWALKSVSPLLHAPTGGPWSFGARPAYIAARTRALLHDESSVESLRRLIQRYLEGFGPASAADVAQFAMIRRSRVRDALSALSGTLEQLQGPGGEVLFDIPGAIRPSENTPAAPRLMAMWDSVLLAYADRGRIVPPDYRKLVTRSNGDVLPTLLVDGYVAGVWRPVQEGIEATAFHRLPLETWDELAAEARAMVALLAGREPTVYRRYHHWWATLPGAEVRVLGGGT